MRPIYDPVVISGTFCKSSGFSGDVSIMAPLPGADSAVVPMTFVAVILAQIDDPHSRSKGLDLKILTGTIQVSAAITSELDPSQFRSSVL
jgi:hypothetical protein